MTAQSNASARVCVITVDEGLSSSERPSPLNYDMMMCVSAVSRVLPVSSTTTMQVGPLDEYGPEVRQLVGKTRQEAFDCDKAARAFNEKHYAAGERAMAKHIGIDFARLTFTPNECIRPFGKEGRTKQTSEPSPRARLPLHDHCTYRLRVLESLSSGGGQWSQVYKCAVEGEGLPDNVVVVLKLYQESLFPFPNSNHFYPWLKYDFAQQYQPAEYFIKRESFAYDTLAEEQGRLIPWCYGFYKFELPCGESVEAVILEFVHGQPLPDFLADNLQTYPATKADEPFIHSTFDVVFKAYTRLLGLGVAHGDGGYGNILVAPGASFEHFSVILLDFGLAMGKDFCPAGQRLQRYAHQAYSCLRESYESVVPDELCDSLWNTDILRNAKAIFNPRYG